MGLVTAVRRSGAAYCAEFHSHAPFGSPTPFSKPSLFKDVGSIPSPFGLPIDCQLFHVLVFLSYDIHQILSSEPRTKTSILLGSHETAAGSEVRFTPGGWPNDCCQPANLPLKYG